MQYLLLAVLSSAMISLLMRLSTDKVKNNVGMLAVNYFTCLVVAGAYTGVDKLLPADPALPSTVWLGGLQGALYLTNFVLLQMNVQRSGVVLSAIFMKLGLLVSLAVSILAFGETPTGLQIVGFIIAVGAIILINLDGGKSKKGCGVWLVVMLVTGGLCDTMSKVYEQLGSPALAPQFLLYTFALALVLCFVLMIIKKQRIGKTELLFGVLIGVPNYFSAKFLLDALEEISAVIVYPTFSVGTILVITLAGVAFFKERLSKRQWIAVAAILSALIMLNIP